MTKSATEWPQGVIERRDNFSPSSVRGTVGNPQDVKQPVQLTTAGAYTAYQRAIPPTAGPKPGEVIVRKYTEVKQRTV